MAQHIGFSQAVFDPHIQRPPFLPPILPAIAVRSILAWVSAVYQIEIAVSMCEGGPMEATYLTFGSMILMLTRYITSLFSCGILGKWLLSLMLSGLFTVGTADTGTQSLKMLDIFRPQIVQSYKIAKTVFWSASKFHCQATALRSTPVDTKATTSCYETAEAEFDKSSPRGRRHDMWTVGCICTEFII